MFLSCFDYNSFDKIVDRRMLNSEKPSARRLDEQFETESDKQHNNFGHNNRLMAFDQEMSSACPQNENTNETAPRLQSLNTSMINPNEESVLIHNMDSSSFALIDR